MRLLRWKYSWPFLLVLLSIACMVYLNTKMVNDAVDSNIHFAGTINKAGRQRMLSQRLVTHYALRQAGQPGYADFGALLVTWNKTHFMVLDAFVDTDEGKNNERLFGLLTHLDPLQSNLYNLLSDSVSKTPPTQHLQALVNAQSIYLKGIDSVVNELENITVTTFRNVRNKQVTLALVSGVVLFLEVLLLILPHFRRLLQAYRQLKAQRREIGQQKNEISHHYQALTAKNEELMKVKELYALALNGINAGAWYWNMVTNEQEWSPRFYQLLGYQPGEIAATAQTFYSLLFADEKNQVQEALRQHLENNQPYRINIRMRCKDGALVWMETSGKAMRDADGKPIYMAGSIMNIGEEVARRQQLEKSNLQKKELIMQLTHDFTTAVKKMMATLHTRAADTDSETALKTLQSRLNGQLEQLTEKLDAVTKQIQ